jgi:hypothetical protein
MEMVPKDFFGVNDPTEMPSEPSIWLPQPRENGVQPSYMAVNPVVGV